MTKAIPLKNQFHNNTISKFWDHYFLPMGLPILMGLILGPSVAMLIVTGNWVLAFPILFLVPTTILIVRYPFAGIMIWMMVMPWFAFNDTYKFIYFTVHRLFIPIVLSIIILSRMFKFKNYQPTRVRFVELTGVAFIVMGIISIFITGQNWKTIFILQDRFLVPFAGYWLVRTSSADEQELRRLMYPILFVTLGQCIVGLLSWFAPAALPSLWHNRLTGVRLTGSFSTVANFGGAMPFFLVYLYYQAMHHKNNLIRSLLLLIFGLGMACIFFSFTRSVWGAGVIALLGLLYLYPRKTSLLIVIIIPVVMVLSGGALAKEIAYAGERFGNEDTTNARLIMSSAGWNMFLARPFFGWGYENYDRYDWQFMERVGNVIPDEWAIQHGTSHNTYLTILAEMGFIGFSFYILPVIWLLFMTVKLWPNLPKAGYWSRRLLFLLWLPVFGHLFIAQASDFRFSTYAVTLLWINLGFISSIIHDHLRKEQTSSPNQNYVFTNYT